VSVVCTGGWRAGNALQSARCSRGAAMLPARVVIVRAMALCFFAKGERARYIEVDKNMRLEKAHRWARGQQLWLRAQPPRRADPRRCGRGCSLLESVGHASSIFIAIRVAQAACYMSNSLAHTVDAFAQTARKIRRAYIHQGCATRPVRKKRRIQ
jgi:hypothetical protein